MGKSNNQRRNEAKKYGRDFKPRIKTKSKRAKVSMKANLNNAKAFNNKKRTGPRTKNQIKADRKTKK